MKKNILLMIADDLGRMFGAYGEGKMKTPNLDRLAAEGVRFDNAYTSTASCSASRSVVYTGLHTHENGTYGLHHDHHHFMTFEHVETAPKLLGEAGYHTGIIGKVHVGPPALYPWDVRVESNTRDVGWVAAQSARFFESCSDKPFFLTVGFIDPHRDMTRGGFGNDGTYANVPKTVFSEQDVAIPDFLTDVPELRTELAAYYESVARLDHGVGLVLEALEAAGERENTLIMFISDNGAPFLNSKTTLFDAGVRLPMLVKAPEVTPGIVNPNMVSFIDILPTFLDWAGAETVSAQRKGRSFLPILGETEMHDHWQIVYGSHTFHEITNYWPTRFLRTPRYKYHRNVAWQLDFPFSGDIYGSLSWEGIRKKHPVLLGKRPLANYIRRPTEELYDLETDPEEVINLAGDPDHAGLIIEFREMMEIWQKETNDPWLYRDGVSVRAVQHHINAGMVMPDSWDMEWDA